MTDEQTLRIAVAATLRTVADWGTLSAIDEDGRFVCVNVQRSELRRLADAVETEAVEDWTCCPVCEEVICDEGCPIEPLRSS